MSDFATAEIHRLQSELDRERRQRADMEKERGEMNEALKAELAENARLVQEREAAMAVLAPSMPSQGLVDAARQVKQVAIAEKANAEALEAKNVLLSTKLTAVDVVLVLSDVAAPDGLAPDEAKRWREGWGAALSNVLHALAEAEKVDA